MTAHYLRRLPNERFGASAVRRLSEYEDLPSRDVERCFQWIHVPSPSLDGDVGDRAGDDDRVQ